MTSATKSFPFDHDNYSPSTFATRKLSPVSGYNAGTDTASGVTVSSDSEKYLDGALAANGKIYFAPFKACLLYTSPSPRD